MVIGLFFFHHGGFSEKLMDKQMRKYVNGLKQLGTWMIVWPPLREILELSEFKTISMLDKIARSKTGTAHPWTSLQAPKLDADISVVIKQEGRSSGEQIFEVDCLECVQSLLGQLPVSSPGYRWYCQAFVKEWSDVGQWWCLVIGGKVSHIIQDGPFGRQPHDEGRTLANMSQ